MDGIVLMCQIEIFIALTQEMRNFSLIKDNSQGVYMTANPFLLQSKHVYFRLYSTMFRLCSNIFHSSKFLGLKIYRLVLMWNKNANWIFFYFLNNYPYLGTLMFQELYVKNFGNKDVSFAVTGQAFT